MIKVGISGMGFMGWIHWLAYQQTPGIEVVAIATRDAKRRSGDWTDIQGNFGPPGEQVDLSGVKTYETLEQMLADPEIDLVDLCLPPSMHADMIAQATAAGKHVFCEKPFALSVADCERAIKSARDNDRMLMIGHSLPFFVEYQYATEAVRSGRYGKLLGGNFDRVISNPTWLEHFFNPAFAGGPLFDLSVHDAHYIRMLFGMPHSADCCGRIHGEVVEYCSSIFRFDDPSLAVTCTTGVIHQQGRPFMHGYEIHFEKATLQFQMSALAAPHAAETSPLKVLTADGTVEFPELGDGDPVFAFVREIQEVVRCLESGKPSEILDGKLAADAIGICDMQSRKILGDKNA